MALFEEENEELESRRKTFIENKEQEMQDIQKEIENIKKDNKKRNIIKNLKIEQMYLTLAIPFVLLPTYLLFGFNCAKATPFVIDKDKYYMSWKTDIDSFGNKNETQRYTKDQTEHDKLYYLSDWQEREDGRFEREERIYDVENIYNDKIYEIVEDNDGLKLEPLKDNLISTTRKILPSKPEEEEPTLRAEIYDVDENDIKELSETEKRNKISTLSYLGLVCVGEYIGAKKYSKSEDYKYFKRKKEDLEEEYKPLTDEKLKKRLKLLNDNYNVLTRR